MFVVFTFSKANSTSKVGGSTLDVRGICTFTPLKIVNADILLHFAMSKRLLSELSRNLSENADSDAKMTDSQELQMLEDLERSAMAAVAKEEKFSKQQRLSSTLNSNSLEDTLANYYGYNFRAGQRDVISAALAGQDTCVFWSTGSGKSLCYTLTAMHSDKLTVVISPLISLMQDQVTGLNNTVGATLGKDVAVFLGSSQMDGTAERRVFEGQYKIVFATPEKATGRDGFVNGLKCMAQQDKLGLLAIDEAHCISQWGHDFRPAFKGLCVLREQLPSVPIMALTATGVCKCVLFVRVLCVSCVSSIYLLFNVFGIQ